MPTAPRRRLVAVAVLFAGLAAGGGGLPADALGGEYTIYSCEAALPEGLPGSAVDARAAAFPEARPGTISTAKMLSTTKGRRCVDTRGGGTRGLLTMNYYQRGGTAPKGAKARYITRAPVGTHFSAVRWGGSTKRRDCRWTLRIYTRGPGPGKGTGTVAIRNKQGAAIDCRGENKGRAAFVRFQRVPGVEGATRFVQTAFCAGNRRSAKCSNRAPNYAQTQKLHITISDPTPPSVSFAADNPFTGGAWVGAGAHKINYTATDNTGVRHAKAYTADGSERGLDSRACDYRGLGSLVPCPNGPGAVTVETDKVAEGSQPLALLATDSAGNVAWSNAVTVRVDRTAPGAVATGVAGGEGWRSTNDFHVGWANPAEPDRAPIVAANYNLCPAGGGACVDGRREGNQIAALPNVSVPAEGEWQLRMWRVDEAGNQQEANASQPVTLRLDSTPPRLGFEATSAADPTLLAAQVNDPVSGLAGGQIEISRAGSGSWQQLPTTAQGSRLLARVDDARLPRGSYQVRAFAGDQAGNQGSTDRRLDGQPMTIRVPLRISTRMRAGLERRKTVTRRVGRKGKRRRVQRRVTVLDGRARARFGRQIDVAGRLTNSDGQPLPGAPVQVYSSTETSPEQLIATLTTGKRGRYRYRARASSSRVLRFTYGGSAQILPSERRVTLVVPAASGIRVRPRRAANGRAVRFRGRLKAPAPDKLVELQARLPGRWQTFKTVKTGDKGVWKARYRFGATCGTNTYTFRGRVPRQPGYPYATGATRTVAVRVKGRRCR